MRYLLERWYVVPILALVALYFSCIVAVDSAREIADGRVREKIDRIYRLAQSEDYKGLKATHLLSDYDIHYLKQQRLCFGPIESWNIDLIGDPTDRIYGSVNVIRKLAQNQESVSAVEGTPFSISPDPPPTSDASDDSRTKLRSSQEALDFARPIFHNLDGGENILSAKAEKRGDQWLIIETLATPQNPYQDGSETARSDPHNYLLLTETGAIVEHVRNGVGRYEAPSFDNSTVSAAHY